MRNYQAIFETIIKDTAQYLIKSGLKTLVNGISGGIDSAVTSAISYEVVKRYPEEGFKFIAVSLPCSSNGDDENQSAMQVMHAFAKKGDYWAENLQKEYLLMKATCEQYLLSDNISQGNIKARLRMIYLYNIASLTNGLVLDNSNMSEEQLGFWTMNGDVGVFSPIGNLWKHEVYELVDYLCENVYEPESDQYKALKTAYGLTPTDGNGVAVGGDMAQIAPGYTYTEVDDILESYILFGDSALDGLYEKYDYPTVTKVIERHKKSEFKRKHLPIKVDLDMFANQVNQ